eukprot:m.392554 g.392554  ORF g.392554 m.392554 type:complete len:69 (-) comp56352_c0_seq6:292-498(-)
MKPALTAALQSEADKEFVRRAPKLVNGAIGVRVVSLVPEIESRMQSGRKTPNHRPAIAKSNSLKPSTL